MVAFFCAGPTGGARAEGERGVLAEGCGAVLGGDVARARDEAPIDARRRALEQVSGTLVDAETITRNAMLFDSLVRTRVGGFVKADRILEEGARPEGLYCVKIEAWVVPQELKERLPELVSEVSVIVRMAEANCERAQVPAIVEGQVVARLVNAGYRVLDPGQLKEVHRRDLALAFERRDPGAVERLRFQFLANLLVDGQAVAGFSQNNQGVVSARAQMQARAIVADSAQVVASVPPDETRGFGASCEAAGRQALQRAGARVGEQLLQGLDQYLKRREREIEVKVRGVPDLDSFRRLKVLVQGERWVSDVRDGQFNPAEATLFLRYPEKTIYLATSLSRTPESRLRLVEFGWSRVVLEMGR